MELTQASAQWASRPDDERYTSLLDMQGHFHTQRGNSRGIVVSSRRIKTTPVETAGLTVTGPNGHSYAPTNWAFGQLATLAGAPAGYLRKLPSPLAADCVNWGMIKRPIEDVGVLISRGDGTNEMPTLRAATGPNYGRVWNADVVDTLVTRFGDGITGDWKVPGEFGKHVTVTKANTTLYASDRDFFVFLADEDHKIEIPNRRDGKPGWLSRGFFVWNSEVGAMTLGLAMFLFDYACCNRIVWGAEQFEEIKVRHTISAPEKWADEIVPALKTYRNASDKGVRETIKLARETKLGDDMTEFLANRFGKGMAAQMATVHQLEEGRPMQTRWDAVVAATAVARGIQHQDTRVNIERQAGKLLLAA